MRSNEKCRPTIWSYRFCEKFHPEPAENPQPPDNPADESIMHRQTNAALRNRNLRKPLLLTTAPRGRREWPPHVLRFVRIAHSYNLKIRSKLPAATSKQRLWRCNSLRQFLPYPAFPTAVVLFLPAFHKAVLKSTEQHPDSDWKVSAPEEAALPERYCRW